MWKHFMSNNWWEISMKLTNESSQVRMKCWEIKFGLFLENSNLQQRHCIESWKWYTKQRMWAVFHQLRLFQRSLVKFIESSISMNEWVSWAVLISTGINVYKLFVWIPQMRDSQSLAWQCLLLINNLYVEILATKYPTHVKTRQ